MRPPPSAKTISMQSRSSSSVAALSFGVSKPRLKKSEENAKVAPLTQNDHQQPPIPTATKKTSLAWKRAISGLVSGTELERSWKLETECVRTTFEAIRTELQCQKGSKRPPGATSDEGTTKRAHRILKSVERDVKDLVQAIKVAETSIESTLDSEPWEQSRADQSQPQVAAEEASLQQEVNALFESDATGYDEDINQLTCHDQLVARNGPSLSEYAARELTVLAAQDAALMRELTRVLRKSAVKLAEQRMESTARAQIQQQRERDS